jgi:hypothetical protein
VQQDKIDSLEISGIDDTSDAITKDNSHLRSLI